MGYSLEAAVADVIDNSIAAGARNIAISFFPLNGAYISILDDGCGMNAEKINLAMQYGSYNPLETREPSDLGRFGLGLKTASLSQCRILTVASKQNGIINVRRWDLDFVRSTGLWSLISLTEDEEIQKIPDIEDLMNINNGTLVVWQNLDRMKAGTVDFTKAMGKGIDDVRDHLALVYHRYLSGEPGLSKIQITINGDPIQPLDPFMTKKSDQTMQEETFVINGSRIKVQPFILPHISKMSAKEIKEAGGKDGLRKLQGFYVYRNKRLLVWGTWFRMMRKGELSKLARIRVDIPNTLDGLWTLDIKKSSAIPPEEVRNNLINIIDKIGEKSKLKFTRRGKIETSDKEVHFWNRLKARDGGYYYEINRNHPMVENLANELGDSRQMLYSVLSQIEKNIPLNQLYIDLSNEEQVTNEQPQQAKEVEASLKSMISDEMSKDQKLSFLTIMKDTPPFKNYPEVMKRIIQEVNGNE